jgi:hypothetical protein
VKKPNFVDLIFRSVFAGIFLISSGNLYAQTKAQIQGRQFNSWSVQHLNQCTKQLRRAPPVWVVPTGYDAQRDSAKRKNQNFVVGEQVESTQPFVLPKRSIVQLSPKAQRYYELGDNTNKLIGVRVLSVAPENTKLGEDDLGKIKDVANYREHKTKTSMKPQFAAAGDLGFLKMEDIEKVQDQKGYVFMVKKETPLHQFLSNQRSDIESFALQLHQQDGKFLVNECCGEVLNREQKKVQVCKDFAIYKVIDLGSGDEVPLGSPLEADCEDCLMKHVIPMQKDFAQPLASILSAIKTDSALETISSVSKLNFVDSRGYVQIPVDPSDSSSEYRRAPFGSMQYEPEKGNADLYLKPEVACGFTQVLKTWQKRYCSDNSPNCRIEFGNASHAVHDRKTRNKNAWPHESHDRGECMDIRPNYKKSTNEGRTFSSSQFDETKFINMMNLFNQLGPESCFTSHNKMNRLFQNSAGCSYRSDHDDHLHICFPRYNGSKLNNKLLNACQNGVN